MLPSLALVASAALVPFAALHSVVPAGRAPVGYLAHFIVIGVCALMSGLASGALTYIGVKRRDGRAVLVGAAFSIMSVLLAIHGLGTEEVLLEEGSGLGPAAGAAVLPIGGAVLALSALPSLRRPKNIRFLLQLQATVLGAVAAFAAVGFLNQGAIPEVPEPAGPLAIVLMVAGVLFFGALTQRAVRTYLLTRRRADLLVMVGTVWLGIALIPQLMTDTWTWSGWVGHALEFLGIGLVGGPVALDLYRGYQSRPLVGDLEVRELVEAEEAFLGPRVGALMQELAAKDAYTEGHTRRVATLAVQVGERLGLSAPRLRALAIGGVLHDIGKLSVPDRILQKPGPLDDEEFAVIRRHPEWGVDLLDELGGFGDQVRTLVGDHHELLDGNGYPAGLAGDEIDLETRILTVCDVYDALISKRVYREAWSQERAFDLLHEESGRGLDPLCVATLQQLVEGRLGRADVDRDAVQDGVARQWVDQRLVRQQVGVDSRVAGGDA